MKKLMLGILLLGLTGAPVRADMLVSNYGAGTITRYDETTGSYLSTFVSFGSGGLSAPMGLAYHASGDLLVVNFSGNNVLRYDGSTGAFVSEFIPSTHLAQPTYMKVGPDGKLYVASSQDSNLVRYNAITGAFVDIFVSGSGLNGPYQFGWNTAGDLLVTSSGSSAVLAYNGTTGAALGSATSAPIAIPIGLVTTLTGNFFVSDYDTNSLRVIQSNGTQIDQVATGSGPYGMVLGPGGNLYIANFNSNFVSTYGSGGMNVFASSNMTNPVAVIFTPTVPEPVASAILAGAAGLIATIYRTRRRPWSRATPA